MRILNILAYLRQESPCVKQHPRPSCAFDRKKEDGGRCDLLLPPSWNEDRGAGKFLSRGSAKIKAELGFNFNDEIE